MTSDLIELLFLNLCFLAAGAGVTAVCGWWRGASELGRSLGVSYLAGVAAFGVTAQLLYVLGASLARWQVLAICAVAGSGVVVGRQKVSDTFARCLTPVWPAVALAAFLALIAVDLWWQPLWTYDAWTFWTPKAHALVTLDGLHAPWFSAADLPNKIGRAHV